MTRSALGPDLVVAGAARGGTSSLAAALGSHPQIDPGSVKESNYFSRALDRGPEWYEGLYAERREGLLRMDASTSYTSVLHKDALEKLSAAAPDAFVVYSVRHPTERALSHYLFRHHYFLIEDAPDFGAALRSSGYYEGGSDYSYWLTRLRDAYPERQLLVVPFELVTGSPAEAVGEIFHQLQLPPAPAAGSPDRHRNDVVAYRTKAVRRASSLLRRSPMYPRLRTAMGADRMRAARGLLTRKAQLPSTEESMASLDAEQRERLSALERRAGAAVYAYLRDQDARLGLNWAERSFAASVVRP